MGEEWESAYKGAEKDHEGTRTGAGELACGEKPSGHAGSSEPDVTEESRREDEDKDAFKKPVAGGPVYKGCEVSRWRQGRRD